MAARKTSFSDVCGTMDELKRLLHEEHERVVADPVELIEPLLNDARYMLDRMQQRLETYRGFRARFRDILARLEEIEDVEMQKGLEALEFLRGSLEPQEEFRKQEVQSLSEGAERVRAVASAQEGRLRSYKDQALAAYDLFQEIKGSRPWIVTKDAASSFREKLEKQHQAWLPPEPHRERLLGWLSDARAVVADEAGPRDEPIVQFEDGGSIPMSQVRWSEAIGNFHPASFEPGPTGRNYRR